jgi:hypothetical protein
MFAQPLVLGQRLTHFSKMTDVYEGSLIRLFRRLEELLRQIAQAAKVMGSEELEQKFTAALELVRLFISNVPYRVCVLYNMVLLGVSDSLFVVQQVSAVCKWRSLI